MVNNFLLIYLVIFLTACNNNQTKTFSHWVEPYTGLEFILIPKGSFYMGNSLSRLDSSNNEFLHLVTISHDFWLARMEITQEQWQKVMGDEELHPDKPNPFCKDNPGYPVVSKSFYDVINFIKRLNTLSSGNRFRLPSEAEWEYACRAGTLSSFYTGTNIFDTLANFNAKIPSIYSDIGRNIGHPTEVGSYPSNQWGLYDMHSNVWEWVSDWYGQYSSKEEINPQGPPTGTLKVIRGGSWYFGADNARSSTRGTHDPQLWGFSIGFRIVCEKSVGQ